MHELPHHWQLLCTAVRCSCCELVVQREEAALAGIQLAGIQLAGIQLAGMQLAGIQRLADVITWRRIYSCA